MMLFHGFPSKKALKEAISSGRLSNKDARSYFEETSMFGEEYRPSGTFVVCMDHPKRSKFAAVTVRENRIIAVK